MKLNNSVFPAQKEKLGIFENESIEEKKKVNEMKKILDEVIEREDLQWRDRKNDESAKLERERDRERKRKIGRG